mmetsp:Transcript_5636/g.13140  ORF Transcript_5636/g.13140 Transcript_5636/m.13140 type:complete len:224 (+) Transcript_5636:2001-2672(+)
MQQQEQAQTQEEPQGEVHPCVALYASLWHGLTLREDLIHPGYLCSPRIHLYLPSSVFERLPCFEIHFCALLSLHAGGEEHADLHCFLLHHLHLIVIGAEALVLLFALPFLTWRLASLPFSPLLHSEMKVAKHSSMQKTRSCLHLHCHACLRRSFLHLLQILPCLLSNRISLCHLLHRPPPSSPPNSQILLRPHFLLFAGPVQFHTILQKHLPHFHQKTQRNPR